MRRMRRGRGKGEKKGERGKRAKGAVRVCLARVEFGQEGGEDLGEVQSVAFMAQNRAGDRRVEELHQYLMEEEGQGQGLARAQILSRF